MLCGGWVGRREFWLPKVSGVLSTHTSTGLLYSRASREAEFCLPRDTELLDLIRCNHSCQVQWHEVRSLRDLKLWGISPGWLNFKSPDGHPRRQPRQAFSVPLNHLEEHSEGAIPALWQTWQIQTRVRRPLALGALRLWEQPVQNMDRPC